MARWLAPKELSGTMAISAAPRSESLAPASGVDVSNQSHLFAALYKELRRLARRELRSNSAATLSPTTLLHETFLNIARHESLEFGSGAQFLSYASRAMRGLLIDYLRNRQALKRGGDLQILPLQTDLLQAMEADDDFEWQRLQRLHEALESLAQLDPRLAECVDLRFFCGLSFDEIARLKGVSARTVQRDWDKARLLLNRLINQDGCPPEA
jgi:RNA polymerase sigma factor (TIGR02999 family)